MSGTRRPGRPPLDPTDRSAKVAFNMPSRQVDQLHRLAQHHRVSVPALVRLAVKRLLRAADTRRPGDREP